MDGQKPTVGVGDNASCGSPGSIHKSQGRVDIEEDGHRHSFRVEEEARPLGIPVAVLGRKKVIDPKPAVLLLRSHVCAGEDVDVLHEVLCKASPLKPVNVVATLISPRHTHAIEPFVVREGFYHLGVEGVHVVRSDGPCPGPAKKVTEGPDSI